MKLILGEKQPKKWGEVILLLATSSIVVEPPPPVEPEVTDSADVKLRETHFFIERKLSSLHTAGHVCMTWWVSSVVFAGTILGAVWLHRGQLGNSSTLMKIMVLLVLMAFFIGLAAFGMKVLKYLKIFEQDLDEFPKGSREGRLFSTELDFFRTGMRIGTICFIVITLVWIFFWIELLLKCCPVVD